MSHALSIRSKWMLPKGLNTSRFSFKQNQPLLKIIIISTRIPFLISPKPRLGLANRNNPHLDPPISVSGVDSLELGRGKELCAQSLAPASPPCSTSPVPRVLLGVLDLRSRRLFVLPSSGQSTEKTQEIRSTGKILREGDRRFYF